ncbi:recombinase family protein [Microbacterium sp. TNHR37B]|uniref:recombinase family protein n=1 Tax=Microbacterium sp. TNHR37B TaxID=1775956 RepID=UPI0007B2409D|nr:recombinase family protein [Microbacterium sp. TNHR37B]KZE89105.1 hypothetical protein AVP41_01896 [Microbacterium sp. TNHR37B]
MARGISTASRQTTASASRHAAIYTRISDDKEGLALGVQRQREDCLAKAEALGLAVVADFEDNDTSASTRSRKRRPGYEDMLSRARGGEFSTIIAYSNSRITRRPRELEDLITLFERHGTVIRTVVSGDDNLATADGRMVARIKAAVDAAEAERVGERVERSARQRVESGRWHGGVPPFGYRKEDKQLHVDEAESKLVLEAVTRVLDQDDTLYGIVRDWSARGVTTRRGSAWRRSVLHKVLTNPALAGINSAGVENCWEAIIDKQTHERLTDRLAPDSSRRTNPLGVKSSKHVLGGGIVVCGACEKPLYPVARKGVPTKLVCRAFVNGDHPNHPRGEATGLSTGRVSIDAEALEAHLYAESVKHLDDLPFWDAVKRKRETDDIDAKALRDTRETRKGERDRAARAFIAGIMSERDAQAEVSRLDAEIASLTQRIDARHGGPLAVDVWAHRRDVLAAWEHWTVGERRLFFRDLISRVVIGPWPEGIPTTTLPKKSETAEAFRARRDGIASDAMKARVIIDWRKD